MHIRNEFEEENIKKISEQIYTIIASQSKLTKRSKNQITHWLTKNQIYVMYHKDGVVGFIVSDPIDREYSEIKSWYVVPDFRNQDIGSKLLDAATRNKKTNYLLSTFEKTSIIKLNKYHFKEIRFLDLPTITTFRLLSSKRISSIAKHLFRQKSYLLCKYANI